MQLTPQMFAGIINSMRSAGTGAGHEKRRATRIELETSILIAPLRDQVVTHTMTGLSRDISLTGAGLLLSRALPKGQEVVLQLPLDHDETVPVLCTTMHCRMPADSLFIVGAEFSRLLTEAEFDEMNTAGQSAMERIQHSILV